MAILDLDDDSMISAKYRHIIQVVNKYEGNKTHAARALGVEIQTLRRWFKSFQLMGADFSGMKTYQRKIK